MVFVKIGDIWDHSLIRSKEYAYQAVEILKGIKRIYSFIIKYNKIYKNIIYIIKYINHLSCIGLYDNDQNELKFYF